MLRTALTAVEERLGPNHQAAVVFRTALATLGQPKGAAPAVPGRPEIERAFGKDSLETALGGNAIEKLPELINTGRYTEAEEILKRNLATIQEKLGADNPAVGTLLAGLSMLYLRTGRLADSEDYGRRALALLEAKFGADHPNTASEREVLAAALVKQDRVPEAMDQFDKARRSRRRLLEQTLPALAEDDQIAFLHTTFTTAFDLAMGAVWSARNRPGVADRSASWISNHKAVALRALAQRAVLARQAADPRVAPIVRELTEARRRLASLALSTAVNASDSAGPRREFDEMVAHSASSRGSSGRP